MTGEEWINEFSTQQPQPKTVLHASNLPAASSGAIAGAPSSGPRPGRSNAHIPRQRYPYAAMCIAGLVGFAMARKFAG